MTHVSCLIMFSYIFKLSENGILKILNLNPKTKFVGKYETSQKVVNFLPLNSYPDLQHNVMAGKVTLAVGL